MNLEININKDEENERIVIFAREMTEELQNIVQYLENALHDTKLYGKKDDEIYPLDIEKIIRFYTENKQIYVEILSDSYKVGKRLYELEKLLPKHFIRISQSEIINIHYIKKLKQEINGFIKISFKNGKTTFSSRRYVKIIKEALQLWN